MQELFGSPGMIAVFTAMLLAEVLSLLLLFINIRLFYSQLGKYRQLLSAMSGPDIWGKRGRVLVPLYVVCTLGVTLLTLLTFLFQPHLL